jgi:hypothetical protein
MKQSNKKVVKNKFKWTPMEDRVDKLGLPLPPRKPEIGRPVLWIAIEPQGNFVKDIYLVNETGGILENVIASIGGLQSYDDDVFGISGSEIKYKNIENGDAVKIDEYDEMADSDSVLQIYLKVKIKGKWLELKSSSLKGGFKEEVLIWG